MTTLIRLMRHPSDAEIVLAQTPPDWNSVMGRFAPARYAPDLRAYLIHRERVPAFARFVGIEGGRLVDERVAAPSGPPTAKPSGPECANCGQPGSFEHPPKMCPSCGQPWTVVYIHERAAAARRVDCPRCGAKNRGHFPFCAGCGGALSVPAAVRAPAVVPVVGRGGDPKALAEVVAETMPDRPETACAADGCYRPTRDGICDHCRAQAIDDDIEAANAALIARLHANERARAHTRPEPDPEPPRHFTAADINHDRVHAAMARRSQRSTT